MRFSAFAVAALFALGACSGSPSSVSPAANGTLPVAPAAVSPAAKKKHKLVPIHVSFTLQRSKKRHERHPRFISPSSTQITITLNTVDGNAPPAGLLTSVTTNLVVGTNCTNHGLTWTCTVSGPKVPVGNDSISFVATDGTKTLSTVTQAFAIVAGASNSLTASLRGVPATFGLSTGSLTAGTAVASQNVSFHAFDPDGNPISQSSADYSTPLTISTQESDGFGALLLSVNGGTPAASVVVNNPTDTVTLSYSGLSIVAPKFNISATGASTGTFQSNVANSAPAAVCSDSGAGICADGPQVNLYNVSPNTGSNASLTLTQPGWTESPFLRDVTESDDCGASGANIASVAQSGSTNPGGAGTVYAISTLGTPSAGASCTVTLKGGDPTNTSLAVTITYTVSGIGVNARHHG